MRKQSNSLCILGSLLFLLLFLHSPIITADEKFEDEREFDYSRGSVKGPERWGQLKPEWTACKNGKMQSPVDMWNRRVDIITNPGLFKINYKPSHAILKNRGHDISLQWVGDAGSIQINGTDYFLQQGHWHSPSEHTINGRRYDLELHMVHSSKTNNTAVLGVLYKFGKPDAFLSKLMTNISSTEDQNDKERNMGLINPEDLKPRSKNFYRYMGSLTIPPCTEGVIWTINKEIKTASKNQVHWLREAVHDYAERNARPLQPLHHREIHLYSPKRKSH